MINIEKQNRLIAMCGTALAVSFSSANVYAWQTQTSSLKKPYRVESSGNIIDTGGSNGHSAPSVVDLDGDGLKDLVVGDFGGRFQLHRNVGSKTKPLYESGGYLQSAGADAKVHIACCIGAQPRFADWNGDAVLDLMTNSYDPGHCHLFLGLPGGGFSEGIEVYGMDGVPVRSTPLQKEEFQSYGSFFEAVDWDADGDLDLLIGCFDGTLMLRMNEGDRSSYKFSTTNTSIETVQGPIRVKAHCCPVVADWDSDGRWDIITGSDDGSVTFFRNIGTANVPVFSQGVLLVAPAEDNWYFRTILDDDDFRPGIRSQVEVADVNADGRLDLLLGDYYLSLTYRKDLTDAEKEEVRKLTRAYDLSSKAFMTKIAMVSQQVQAEFPADKANSSEGKDREAELYEELWKSPEGVKFLKDETLFYQSLSPYLTAPNDEIPGRENTREPHGHVWVFIRNAESTDHDTSNDHKSEAVKEMSDSDPVLVRISANNTVRQGEKTSITVEVEVAPGYEIQSVRAKPPAVPTKVDFTLPAGLVTIGSLQVPETSRSLVPGKTQSYSGRFEFTQVLELAGSAFVPGEHTIEVAVSYQACDSKKCLRPVQAKVELPIKFVK
jgi:hypothetical protein